MEKDRFHRYESSAYVIDPVFKSKDFDMYGNAGTFDAPILFEVGKYRYVLSKPLILTLSSF